MSTERGLRGKSTGQEPARTCGPRARGRTRGGVRLGVGDDYDESGGSDSNTGAIVAGCVFGAFALLFVGAVAYFYRLSPEEQAAAKEKFWAAEAEGEKKFWAAEAEGEKQVAAAKEKFWAAEAEGEKQVKALFAKAEAEGEPEAAAEEAAP